MRIFGYIFSPNLTVGVPCVCKGNLYLDDELNIYFTSDGMVI